MTYRMLVELKDRNKLGEEEQDLLDKIKEEIDKCYYGEEIQELYEYSADIEKFRSLLVKYSDIDFGTGLGQAGILACEEDNTGYLYNLVTCSGVNTLEMHYIHDIAHNYANSLILWIIVEELLDKQIDVFGALTIAKRHLQEIGLGELTQSITQTSYKEGLIELNIIELLHRVDREKLNEICSNISSQRITDRDKMAAIFKEEIKLISLGKNLGAKIGLLGTDKSEIEKIALTNVLYLILNEETCNIEHGIENGERVIVGITYGNKSASTRPDDSEVRYELAYKTYGQTHKSTLDSLTGLELCRLCMIAKATSYTAEEALELAVADEAYNKFMTDIYNS